MIAPAHQAGGLAYLPLTCKIAPKARPNRQPQFFSAATVVISSEDKPPLRILR